MTLIMDFSLFDGRGYPVISVDMGYAEWANHYDATVAAGLDRPLLDFPTSVTNHDAYAQQYMVNGIRSQLKRAQDAYSPY